MPISAMSSRELNQDVSVAKQAAEHEPVFITKRGQTSHVLLSIADHQRLTQQTRNIADALAIPNAGDIAFDPPRMDIALQATDLS